MLVTIENLKKGDEVVMAHFSSVNYIKLLSEPDNSKGYYKKVKCSYKATITNYNWRGKVRKFTAAEPCADISQHNYSRYMDLRGRTMWLVKREGEFV